MKNPTPNITSMRNAKQELLRAIEGKEVKCAIIRVEKDLMNEEDPDNITRVFLLAVDYDTPELDELLNDLDFDYDAGYGLQRIYGTVWFTDGTWLDRGEYDGSEWWELQECPEIPKILIDQN
jgi:hypothetical protein